jgi:hypothetical protein
MSMRPCVHAHDWQGKAEVLGHLAQCQFTQDKFCLNRPRI